MSDSDISENLELKFIQEHLELASGNALLCSNNSNLKNLLSYEKLHVFSDPTQTNSIHIDNLLSTDTFHIDLSKYNQKFDTIIIRNLLEQTKYPKLFLQNLASILDDNGIIICSISNFFHITNIINLLVGNLFHNEFSTRFYDLDAFLFFLNKNNMHVTNIFRIKKDFSSQQMNIDATLIPSTLIDMFQKIPDYDTQKYVFMISKGKTVPTENLEFVSQFPKNYLLPQLQEFFEKFVGLENSIKEQKAYTVSVIQELKAYTGNALSEKDKLIEGFVNSVEEQRVYIENLKENIIQLESKLKKLKFWKR